MRAPKGYKTNYPCNLLKGSQFGADYKLIAISYWLSRYHDQHSMIQVMFQNANALDDEEKIISILFEAFANGQASLFNAPSIRCRHFFDNGQTALTLTEMYIEDDRLGNYQQYKIPKHKYLPNQDYNSVLDKVQAITKRAQLKNGDPAYRIGTDLIRGNGCHAYALNILESLAHGLYPDQDFGFEIRAQQKDYLQVAPGLI